jgi:hypothetical protein
MAAAIKEKLSPLIKEACDFDHNVDPEGVSFYTWEFGKSSLRLVLQHKMWKRLLAAVEGKGECCTNFEKAEKSRKEINVHPASQHWVDETERLYFNAPRFRRVVDDVSRQRGIMLPFGCPVGTFKVPNPYVYYAKHAFSYPFFVHCC